MSLIGILSCSGIGMESQAHALEQIGTDIANIGTTGYKSINTLFQTELYHYNNTDDKYFTATPVDVRTVDKQGNIVASTGSNDLAISGNGFFLIQKKLDSIDNIYLTRNGAFGSTSLDPSTMEYDSGKAFLITAAGDYVLGWQYDSTAQTYATDISALDVTPTQDIAGNPTSLVSFDVNIPASDTPTETIGFNVYDSEFTSHDATMILTKSTTATNQWSLTIGSTEGTVLSPTTATEILFDGSGNVISPSPATSEVSIAWNTGTTSSFSIDFSELTQLGNTYFVNEITNDGLPTGTLKTTGWNSEGVLTAGYSNGKSIPVAKLAIGSVVSPNLLTAISNTMFQVSEESGDLTISDLTTDPKGVYTSIVVSSLESSNVSIESEFSTMITTQRAYSSNATVFTTGNEMYQTAISILS